MTKTLVIGYGNPLRGDDGIGWAAAELLADYIESGDTRVLARHQLMPELAEQAARCDLLLLIDASVELAPGQVHVERVGPAAYPGASHNLSPGAFVACARAMYGSAPEAWLISVGGESFKDGASLSPPVAAALRDVLRKVRELVQVQV